MKCIAIVLLTVGILLIAACGEQPALQPTEEPLVTTVPSEPTPTTAPPTDSPAEEPFESPISSSLPTDEPFESPLQPGDDTFESPIGLPNPASVYCEEQGYALEMRTSDAGTTGYCIFPDGTECEEWAYSRGECAPGTPAP
jgi:putative hemolysin